MFAHLCFVGYKGRLIEEMRLLKKKRDKKGEVCSKSTSHCDVDPPCRDLVMPSITSPPHRGVRTLMLRHQSVVIDEESPPHRDVAVYIEQHASSHCDVSSGPMICSRPMGVCAFQKRQPQDYKRKKA